MLFIYSSLQLGGIETFIMRMAKARFLIGKKTKVLLLDKKIKNDHYLISETEKYADIFFLEDFYKYNFNKYLPIHLLLIKNIKFQELYFLFKDISQIHVTNSICGLFYKKIADQLNLEIPLTIGIYHAKEFTWYIDKLPYFEKLNREFFRRILSSKGVIFFNEMLPKIYSKYYNISFNDLNLFPLGVIADNKYNVDPILHKDKQIIKIVSVGRLVKFKTYNLYMLDIINKLKDKYKIEYHVYGTGPLDKEMMEKIRKYNLENYVFLKGELPYSQFSKTLKEFDIFIGSGTSIVEASSLGLPSIIAIETNIEPLTYGYLSDIKGFTYHEDNLYDKVSVEHLLIDFFSYSSNKVTELKNLHIKWTKKFLMNECVINFDKVVSMNDNFLKIDFKMTNRECYMYSLSFLAFELYHMIRGKKSSQTIYS